MPHRRLPPLLVPGLLLAGALAACRSAEEEHDVSYYVRHGRYEKAVEVAREELDRRPDDPAAREVYRQAQVAYVMSQGRLALFDGQDELALDLFYQALALDEQNPHAATWIRKTRNQLAERWLDQAQGLSSETELEEALLAYEKVLEYVLVEESEEENERVAEVYSQARLGLARVLLRMNYRAGQSETYYRAGLHAFREWLLQEARTNFEKAGKYADSELGDDRQARVEDMLAQERLFQARELEATGFYFAARNEYRLVLLIDPDNAAAQAGLDRMDRETRSARKMSEAEMGMLRGEFERAREPLEEAKALTRAQVDRLSLLEWQIEDARLRAMYDLALDLERDYRYPEAIETFTKLLDEVEYYEDAIARRNTLQWLVQSAEELYAKADAAETDEEEFQSLWEIHNVVWPEYRDVEERLAGLNALGHGVASATNLLEPPEPKLWQPASRRRRTFSGEGAAEAPVEVPQETTGEGNPDH